MDLRPVSSSFKLYPGASNDVNHPILKKLVLKRAHKNLFKVVWLTLFALTRCN